MKIAIVFFSVILCLACEKEAEISLKFTELEVWEVEYRAVSVWYALEDADKYEVEELGICYTTTQNPTIHDSTVVFYNLEGTMPLNKGNLVIIKGLSANTTYYMRGYYKISGSTYYSKETAFSTNALDKPIVSTNEIKDISASYALAGGKLVNNNGSNIIACGTTWSTTENPNLSDHITNDSIYEGMFSSVLTGLQPSTTYYARAYATNKIGTSYGAMQTFTTDDGIPELLTLNVIDIQDSTVISGGMLINKEGVPIIDKGVCWNTKGAPTVYDSEEENIMEEDSFVIRLDNLIPGTTYYIRSFARSAYGVGYGQEIRFKTLLTGTLVDYDGNNYRWVQIGNQKWMAENLKVTHYPNGKALDYMAHGDWHLMYYGGLYYDVYGYFSYKDNSKGAFYIWNVAIGGDTESSKLTASGIQGICPDGWHLPSASEWTELEHYLIEQGFNYDGSTTGNKIGKSVASASSWKEDRSFPCDPGDVGYNQVSNNASGFSAYPYGHFQHGRHVANDYDMGEWWSSTTRSDDIDAYCRTLYLQHPNFFQYYRNKLDGLNVRCIKNE